MKKLSSKIKNLFIAIIVLAIAVTTASSVNAAPKSIQLGTATHIKGYIAGVYFSDKVTTDGKYLYCLNMHKNTATNIKANLVSNSKYIDGGVVYILKNGYPNKKITGNNERDYYITQTAVWWYLDKVTGSQNLGDEFKSTGSDDYGLRQYVKQLVNDGYKHRNDSIAITEPKIQITSTSDSMVLDNNYYVSGDITAKTLANIDSIHFSNKYPNSLEIIQRANSLISPEPVRYGRVKASGWVE